MSSTLLDGSVVESDAMLAAGSLLIARTRVPRGQLWAGRPARFLRELRPEELASFAERAAHYVALGREYREL
jgi:carbonic anhydrase/acetyltransferase-like protein (isoleucine patch superfamily)